MNSYVMVGGQYVFIKKLGVGSFGEIYAGIDIKTKKKVAIKIERIDPNKAQLLEFEANVYRYLYQENKGIPQIYWNGAQDDFNVLVVDMLGPNLENLFSLCNRQFSLKTTIGLALGMIERIQYVHSKGIMHRDIKPENFLIGDKNNNIYIIDYGLCKLFKNKNNEHIPPSQNKQLVGTVRYTSINSHIGHELSRRDDLESIGYILIYFIKGKLPWQGLNTKVQSKEDKYDLIYKCKLNTSLEQLCQGLPKEFKLYMEHVKSLAFSEKPNYSYLYGLFNQLFKKSGFEQDGIYDWTNKKSK